MVQGISDVIFEVMYGASQDLHSKAASIQAVILSLLGGGGEVSLAGKVSLVTKVVRLLYIKLFNAIDASKQLPLFEQIHQNLITSETESIHKVRLALFLF